MCEQDFLYRRMATPLTVFYNNYNYNYNIIWPKNEMREKERERFFLPQETSLAIHIINHHFWRPFFAYW
jgi:cell division protein FtsB